jgi:hypothetical protein
MWIKENEGLKAFCSSSPGHMVAGREPVVMRLELGGNHALP